MAEGKVEIKVTADTSKAVSDIKGVGQAAESAGKSAQSAGSGAFSAVSEGAAKAASDSAQVGDAAQGAGVEAQTAGEGAFSGVGEGAEKAAADSEQVGDAAKAAGEEASSAGDGSFDHVGEGADEAQGHIESLKQRILEVAGGTLLADGIQSAVGAVSDGVKQMVSDAYEGYGEYEQLVGGMDTLFKDSSEHIQRLAANAAQRLQISANDYMSLATDFSASLLSGLGGDTEAAVKYADMAISDMSDNANKMGSSVTDVQNAYKGFAKQNYTMLDNLKLGYGGTAEEMARLVNESGVMGDSFKATSKNINEVSFDKIIEAIHVTQEKMGMTGVSAEEAATTVQGSTAAMEASWSNFLVALGTGDYETIGTTFAEWLDSVGVMLENAVPVLVTIVESAVSLLLETLYENLPPGVQEAIDQVLELFNSLGEQFAPTFEVISETVSNGLAAIQEIIGVFAEVAGAIWNEVWPVFAETVTTVWGSIQTIIETAMGLIQSIIDTVLALIHGDWEGVWNGIGSILEGVWNLINTVIEQGLTIISSLISGALGAIQGVWNGIWSTVGSFLTSIWESIKSAVSNAINMVQWHIQNGLNLINGIWSAVWGSIKSFFGDIWNGIKDGARNGIDTVYNVVTGIKDKIVGFFSGAGRWLWDSGVAILNGLKDGIMSAIGSVTSAVSGAVSQIRSFFPFSPAKRGPFSGHGYTTYSGKALMRDWAGAITKAVPYVQSKVEAAVAAVADGFGVGGEWDVNGLRPVVLGDAASAQLGAGRESVTTIYNVSFDGVGRSSDARLMDLIDEVVSYAEQVAPM